MAKTKNQEPVQVPKIVTRLSKPIINRIDLIDGGRGGMKLAYDVHEIRNNVRSNIKSKNVQYRRMVQKEIIKSTELLREHLLRTCGFSWSSDQHRMLDIQATTVIAVAYDKGKDTFQIIGTKRNAYDKEVKLSGPPMFVQDYDEAEELEVILNGLKSESQMFMDGKGADIREVAIAYLAKTQKETVDPASYVKNLDDESFQALVAQAYKEFDLEVINEDISAQNLFESKSETKDSIEQKQQSLPVGNVPEVTSNAVTEEATEEVMEEGDEDKPIVISI